MKKETVVCDWCGHQSDLDDDLSNVTRSGLRLAYQTHLGVTLVTCDLCQHCLAYGQDLEELYRRMTGQPMGSSGEFKCNHQNLRPRYADDGSLIWECRCEAVSIPENEIPKKEPRHRSQSRRVRSPFLVTTSDIAQIWCENRDFPDFAGWLSVDASGAIEISVETRNLLTLELDSENAKNLAIEILEKHGLQAIPKLNPIEKIKEPQP